MKAASVSRSTPAISRQNGAVLLVLLTMIVLLGSSALLAGLNRAAKSSVVDDRQTMRALAEAKSALIGYAVTYYEAHQGEFGFLPCTDENEGPSPDVPPGNLKEGREDGNCAGQDKSNLGRLPWRTLGIPPLRDGSGECLWYAVSGPYKNGSTTKTKMLNEDTNGLFEIYAEDGATKLIGTSPDERAVAVIIAPGPALLGQDRTDLPDGTEICGGDYVATNYLDSANGKSNTAVSGAADTLDSFITIHDATDSLNDRMLAITREELFQAIRRRNDFTGKFYDSVAIASLTQVVAKCIAHFGTKNNLGASDKRLPWPADLNLDDYREDGQYDDRNDDTILSGRVPFDVQSSKLATGNTMIGDELLNDDNCPGSIWTAEIDALWKNWKDHLFYAVAKFYQPGAASVIPPCLATDCLTVNGSGSFYAAIVMFANERISDLGQLRDANPPGTEADDKKKDLTNYLEGRNASNHPNATGNSDYQTSPTDPLFNDILFCIDEDLNVVTCS